MIIYIIATALCTLYLVTKKDEKDNVWQILWIVVCAAGAVFSATVNESEWNKTTVTHWVIQGRVESGPIRNLVFFIVAQALLFMVVSYFLSRLLNAIIRSFRARSERQPLESGEKRKTGSPMHPVCYCCNQPKSLTKDYPSKICGQRICFDCLKELGFNELFSSDERLAAFEGKEPFYTADDVIAELRRRKEQTEE